MPRKAQQTQRTPNKSAAPKRQAGRGRQQTGGPPPRGPSVANGRQVTQRSPGGRVVSRTEFIGAVVISSTVWNHLGVSASTPGYDVNPANPLLFPWLSGIAEHYEEYRFDKLELVLRTRAPTTAAGAVYMAFDYDYNDPVAVNEAEFMANTTAISAPLWMEQTLRVDTHRLNQITPWRYVSKEARGVEDQRLTHAGYFMLAGMAPEALVSVDLLVRYTVTLQLECLPSPVGILTTKIRDNFPLVPSAFTPVPCPEIRGVPKVVSATGATPTFEATAFGGGISGAGVEAYRIPTSLRNITVAVDANLEGGMPSAWGPTVGLGFAAFGERGELVVQSADAVSDPEVGYNIPMGMKSGSAWASVSGIARGIIEYNMAAFIKSYPAARFIVPVIYSQLSRTLKTMELTGKLG